MHPMFTIHAGEYLVANHIENLFFKKHGVRVWVPSKDNGMDLLVTSKNCRKTVSLQVKFSKSYVNVGDCNSSGWWQINRKKLQCSKVDYWVFVMPEMNSEWKFEDNFFLAIPPKKLLGMLIRTYGELEKYDVYFARKGDVVIQHRGVGKKCALKNLFNKPEWCRDFSKYYNNWDKVLKKVL